MKKKERTRILYLVRISVLTIISSVTVGLRRLCHKRVKWKELKCVSVTSGIYFVTKTFNCDRRTNSTPGWFFCITSRGDLGKYYF